jgi:hypothetical protein
LWCGEVVCQIRGRRIVRGSQVCWKGKIVTAHGQQRLRYVALEPYPSLDSGGCNES